MKLKKLLIGIALAGFAFGCYVAYQKPKVWCNREWAGVMFLRGGYRSWSMRFCDGQANVDGDGKLVPCVITPTGYRKGYYRFPKFNHVDVRKLVNQ